MITTLYDSTEKKTQRDLFSAINFIMNITECPLQKRLSSTEKLKREVRQRIAYANAYPQERHYSEDGESYYYKEWFDYPFTEEDKQEFIEDNWVHINAPWSPTGRWFTSHIAVCNVETSFGKKAVAYHFMSLDC